MYSGGGYNFSNYGRTGKEPNQTIGKQHVGNLSLKYLWEEEEEESNSEISDEEESDMPFKKVNNKMVHSLPMGVSDPYALNKTDRGTATKNVGGLGEGFLQEFAGHHKNPVRKGMTPFKQPKHSGPPIGTGGSSQAFKTTGNKIDLGSRKGWSKPYYFKKQGDEKRYFSLMSLIKDTRVDNKQFVKQKNRIKKVLNGV